MEETTPTLMNLTIFEIPDNTEENIIQRDFLITQFEISDGFIHIITTDNIRRGINTSFITEYILSYDMP